VIAALVVGIVIGAGTGGFVLGYVFAWRQRGSGEAGTRRNSADHRRFPY
jgi:hypothetical protein